LQQPQHHHVTVNGIQMHYVSMGQGPLLLLLHGFPEFWYSWRHQLEALSPFFRVVAPDLRGYNETEKPDWGYELDVLVADVLHLIETLGAQRAVLVGHDWGALLAWALAIKYPHRVARFASLHMPHPAPLLRTLAARRRDTLLALCGLPWLPEWLLRRDDYALVERLLRTTAARPDAFSEEEMQTLKDAISKPGVLRAALGWYRAFAHSRDYLLAGPLRVEVPTLLLWSTQTTDSTHNLTQATGHYVPDLRLRLVPGCAYRMQHEQPELINRYLLEFLTEQRVVPERAARGAPRFNGVERTARASTGGV
jgi:pimeloyl-ACP methyl ester carboxylesterase